MSTKPAEALLCFSSARGSGQGSGRGECESDYASTHCNRNGGGGHQAAAQGEPGAKAWCATTSIPADQMAEGRKRAAAFTPKKENPVDEVERDLPRIRQV